MALNRNVTINNRPNARLSRMLTQFQSNAGRTPMDDLLNLWWERYRRFIEMRFTKFSRGGGNWRRLSPLTIARRRKPSKKSRRKGNYAILVDTGQLRNSLKSDTMLVKRRVGNAIEFGFPARKRQGDGLTMGELAKIHQFGTRTIPARRILVQPDAATIKGMGNDARRINAALARRMGG